MQLKDNKTFKKVVVLMAVAGITGAIGVGLSAQMGPRRGVAGEGPQGPGMMGPGPRGQRPMGPGMMGGPGMRGGRGMMGGPGMMDRRGPGGPMGMLGFGLRGLDLTDDQHEQLRAVVEKHRDALQASGAKVQEARRALHEAVIADTPDEAAIKQRAADLGSAEAAAAVLRVAVRKEALNVLTPDQQQTLKERRSQMEQRMKNGRQPMIERFEERPMSDDTDQQDSGPQTV